MGWNSLGHHGTNGRWTHFPPLVIRETHLVTCARSS
jgi:hypothetical protein